MPNTKTPLIKEGLPRPLNKAHDLFKLYDWVHRGLIDLSPTFQRDVVWRVIKMQGLIDSVMKNYYIPPLLFSAHINGNGQTIRHCIDGKQRLSSVMRFMDGQIPYIDDNKQKWYYTLPPGQKGLELPESTKKVFADSCLVCIEYHNITSMQERESFRRVQLGVALSTGEKLYAIESPISERIHALHDEYPNIDSIIDAKRSKAFLVISQSMKAIVENTGRYQGGQVALEKFLVESKPVPEHVWSKIKKGFGRLSQMVDRKYDDFMEPSRVSPIEFVFIGILMYHLSDLDEAKIFHYIKKMRTRVREVHDDIRTNNKVWKTLQIYMDNVLLKENLLEREEDVSIRPAARSLKKEFLEDESVFEEHGTDSESDPDLPPIKVEPNAEPLNQNGKRALDNDFFGYPVVRTNGRTSTATAGHEIFTLDSDPDPDLDLFMEPVGNGKRLKRNEGKSRQRGNSPDSVWSDEIVDSGTIN